MASFLLASATQLSCPRAALRLIVPLTVHLPAAYEAQEEPRTGEILVAPQSLDVALRLIVPLTIHLPAACNAQTECNAQAVPRHGAILVTLHSLLVALNLVVS